VSLFLALRKGHNCHTKQSPSPLATRLSKVKSKLTIGFPSSTHYATPICVPSRHPIPLLWGLIRLSRGVELARLLPRDQAVIRRGRRGIAASAEVFALLPNKRDDRLMEGGGNNRGFCQPYPNGPFRLRPIPPLPFAGGNNFHLAKAKVPRIGGGN